MAFELHAPAGHCRLCPCPDWDAEHSAEQLTQECDTCEHKLGFHLDRFELSQDEVRQRKARAEEALEFCKQRLDGAGVGCACSRYQPSASGECAVCGHKKGWHKAKLATLGSQSRPGSPTSTVASRSASPASPATSSWGPSPPLPMSYSDTHTRTIPAVSKVQIGSSAHLAAPANGGLPLSPPLSPPMSLLRQSLSPTDPAFRHRSDPPTSPLPPIPATRSPSGSTTASEVEAILAQSAITRNRAHELVEAARNRSRAASSEVRSVTPTTLASRAQSPGAPSLLGYSTTQLMNDTDSLIAESVETASIDTGPRSSFALSRDGEDRPYSPPFAFDRTPPILEEEIVPTVLEQVAGSRNLQLSAFPTVTADPTAGPGPRSTSLLRSASNSSAPITTASSSSSTSAYGSTAPSSVVGHLGYDTAFTSSNQSRQAGPVAAGMQRAGSLPASSAISSSASLPMIRRESEGAVRAERTRETSAPPHLQPGNFIGRNRSSTITSTISSSSSLNVDPAIYETSKKMVKLTMSPRLEGRIPPGTTFTCRVDFGEGVLSSDLNKLQLQVVGTSAFEGDPMDRHTFLHQVTPILIEPAAGAPKGALAKMADGVTHADQAFHFQWTLPLTQNCSCKSESEALPLTPTLAIGYAAIGYEFTLAATKRGGKLLKGSVDKFTRNFIVDGPTVPISSAGPTSAPAGVLALSYGQRGDWQTITLPKFVEVKNSKLSVLSSELAWQVDPRPKQGKVLIPYRVTLSFGVPACSVSASDMLFVALQEQFSVYIARTITVRKAGPKMGKDHSRPTLRTRFTDTRQDGKIGQDEFGRVNWSFEGVVETPWVEARSSSTCGVTIRYTLAAKATAKSGLSMELNLIARNLVLEIPTVKVEQAPTPSPSEQEVVDSLAGRPISIDSGLSYYVGDRSSMSISPTHQRTLAPPAPLFASGTPLAPIPSGSTMATTAVDSLPGGLDFARALNSFPTPPPLSPVTSHASFPIPTSPPPALTPEVLEPESGPVPREPQVDFLSALFSSNRSIAGSISSDRPPSHDFENDHTGAQQVEAGPAPAFTMFPGTGEQVLESRGLRLVRRTELAAGGGRGRGSGPSNGAVPPPRLLAQTA